MWRTGTCIASAWLKGNEIERLAAAGNMRAPPKPSIDGTMGLGACVGGETIVRSF